MHLQALLACFFGVGVEKVIDVHGQWVSDTILKLMQQVAGHSTSGSTARPQAACTAGEI